VLRSTLPPHSLGTHGLARVSCPAALLDSRAMLETTVELSAALVRPAGLPTFAGLVGSGGGARQVGQAANVPVIGALEISRVAKIHAGDAVGIEGEEPARIRITSAENA